MRWWRRARSRWEAADKSLAAAAVLAVATTTAFGFLLHSLYVHRQEQRSLACLALNVYFEARGEPRAGQYAVAEVTMNRVASPRYPDSVCDVVYEKKWDALRKRYVSAFSWTEFKKRPEPIGDEWGSARQVARAVYYGRSDPKLAGVMHYHAESIKPSWSRHRRPVARIGNHVFYR